MAPERLLHCWTSIEDGFDAEECKATDTDSRTALHTSTLTTPAHTTSMRYTFACIPVLD